MGKTISSLAAISTMFFFSACFTLEQEPYSESTEQEEQYRDERYEVRLYDSWEFSGHRQGSWYLEPGMRQKLVNFVGWSLNDRISSIRIGYMVGVAMFYDRDFRGAARIYYGSQGRLDFNVNDQFSSMIIFDRYVGEPLGVWLGATTLSETALENWDLPGDSWFFPLPEEEEETVAEYRGVGDANDRIHWVMVPPLGDTRADVAVEVTLYEHDQFRGYSITLPGFRRSDYYFELKDF